MRFGVSGVIEARLYGFKIMTNPSRRGEQRRKRFDELKQESAAGKVMILWGCPNLDYQFKPLFLQ
jgi:hypothetical protein